MARPGAHIRLGPFRPTSLELESTSLVTETSYKDFVLLLYISLRFYTINSPRAKVLRLTKAYLATPTLQVLTLRHPQRLLYSHYSSSQLHFKTTIIPTLYTVSSCLSRSTSLSSTLAAPSAARLSTSAPTTTAGRVTPARSVPTSV